MANRTSLPESTQPGGVVGLDLEFDTGKSAGAPLGDIATSLVSLHDLLRDLGAIAADPASAEYREIQVVGIEMRSPLTIKLSLLAIPAEAVTAFQEICRGVILARERRASHEINLDAALDRVVNAGGRHSQVTEREIERLQSQIAALQNAAVPLKRVLLKD